MSNQTVKYLEQYLNREATDSLSPLGRWLRGIVREVEAGKLTVDFLVREEMTNPIGGLHGGAVAAMLDEALGTAVFSLGTPHFYATVNLCIDFLGTAQLGETVTVQTEVVRQGSNIVNVEGRVYNATGKLLTKASANLVRIKASIDAPALTGE
ncbi:MAG TPA: PaaI family thioesterase [Anaerolineae bacterium]|mgnify:CR=1 FL=1|nr:PaaI family thioesterase [Anaerolineae bacterium]HMR63667.1 PaaI family thioesterase [Anaerolineae bacterium]